MATRLDSPRPELRADFVDRLEERLVVADRRRRRRNFLHTAARILPLVLLAGPVVAWRLMLASPDAAHVAIGALAQVTFGLDVAVHLDNVLLTYLNLQILPSVVGVLLLALITGLLLWTAPQDS